MRRTPKLGQHFLTGSWAAERLVAAAGITSSDTVLEIGPGTGALTKELLKTGAHVIAIEKDTILIPKLRETFALEIERGQFELIEADVRDFDPASCKLKAASYVLAANIPYYITGEILRQFLSGASQPKTMALLVQKEVADRILAGDKKESILSLSVKVYGTPRIEAKVSRGNFSPPPSVDSAILVIENISKKSFSGVSEDLFFKAVRTGFASKRKYLANNLSSVFEKEKVEKTFASCDIDTKARAEDLPLATWLRLAEALSK